MARRRPWEGEFATSVITWFHELGHVHNLAHVDLNLPARQSTNIMHKTIYYTHTMVRDWQCAAYQTSLSPHQEQLATADSAISEGSAKNQQPPQISEFIRQDFIEGVPWTDAEAYTSDDLPLLNAQLAHPDPDVSLPTVVATLGVIGDVRALQPLIDFIESGTGTLSYDEYSARKGALLSNYTSAYR
jgi:hypothetical protein